ncbi:14164_t:CDS:2, partial [Racocetra fulgida]
HQFTDYIEVLNEKANEWQNYTICHACRNAVGRPTALLQKFSTKSSKEAILKILGIGLKEIEKQDTRSYSGERILNYEIEELEINMKIKLKSDSVGSILAFD